MRPFFFLLLFIFLNEYAYSQVPVNDICSGAIMLEATSLLIDFTEATYSGVCNIDCMVNLNNGNLCAKDLWYTITLTDSTYVEFYNVLNETSRLLEVFTGSCSALQYYYCGTTTLSSVLPPETYYFKLSTETVELITFYPEICIIPDIDPINDVYTCMSYGLPQIQGINLSGNQAYYTFREGQGTKYMPGDLISSSIELYAFDMTGTAICRDNEGFSIFIDQTISNMKPQIDFGSWFGSFFWNFQNRRPQGCDHVTIESNQSVDVSGSTIVARCQTLYIENGGLLDVEGGSIIQVGQ